MMNTNMNKYSLTLTLDDKEKEMLCTYAREYEMNVSELIEAFISDLTSSDRRGGSDESDLANQWYNRRNEAFDLNKLINVEKALEIADNEIQKECINTAFAEREDIIKCSLVNDYSIKVEYSNHEATIYEYSHEDGFIDDYEEDIYDDLKLLSKASLVTFDEIEKRLGSFEKNTQKELYDLCNRLLDIVVPEDKNKDSVDYRLANSVYGIRNYLMKTINTER